MNDLSSQGDPRTVPVYSEFLDSQEQMLPGDPIGSLVTENGQGSMLK